MLENGAADGYLTVRIRRRTLRRVLAGLAALLAHGLLLYGISLVPEPKPVEKRIEISLVHPPPPPPPAPSVAPPPKVAKRASPPPQAPRRTSPVLPELPPSESPPENRAQLPVAEKSEAPAPPPEPTTWKERLLAQLSATRPHPVRLATGPLAPSFSNLERVALSDARMHDEETEARLAQDFGPFFRRGLEQLRSNWHPDEVLDRNERACGHQNRTTFAVAVLNHDGDVVDVDLKNPSGCPDLDDEAVAAFKRVAKFPNPPAGIFVGPDGTEMETARYPVRFIVTFDGGLKLFWK